MFSVENEKQINKQVISEPMKMSLFFFVHLNGWPMFVIYDNGLYCFIFYLDRYSFRANVAALDDIAPSRNNGYLWVGFIRLTVLYALLLASNLLFVHTLCEHTATNFSQSIRCDYFKRSHRRIFLFQLLKS